jgi:hypothetical protein
MEKIKPKSIAESIGNVQLSGNTNIAGKTEDLNPQPLFTIVEFYFLPNLSQEKFS